MRAHQELTRGLVIQFVRHRKLHAHVRDLSLETQLCRLAVSRPQQERHSDHQPSHSVLHIMYCIDHTCAWLALKYAPACSRPLQCTAACT